MRVITIQPSQGPNLAPYDPRVSLPYPWHIDPQGQVTRQEFWDGEPAALIGFQRHASRRHVDLLARDWLASDDPDQAVGMWPVFIDASGGMWSDIRPVASVTVTDPQPQPAEQEVGA